MNRSQSITHYRRHGIEDSSQFVTEFGRFHGLSLAKASRLEATVGRWCSIPEFCCSGEGFNRESEIQCEELRQLFECLTSGFRLVIEVVARGTGEQAEIDAAQKSVRLSCPSSPTEVVRPHEYHRNSNRNHAPLQNLHAAVILNGELQGKRHDVCQCCSGYKQGKFTVRAYISSL